MHFYLKILQLKLLYILIINILLDFLMVGAFAHGAIFFVRDYDPELNKNNVLARMLEHKEAIISHLSWASLFLGFHTLGYIFIMIL
jgi:hypothetical protein